MLTAARVREYTGRSGPLALLRDLGYPVAPVEVDPGEWRRGGVTLPWNGEARLRLAARMRRFDLFLLTGRSDRESISQFLRSYKSYNTITKSVIIYQSDERDTISIYDISRDGSLRLLEVDPGAPTAHTVDRLNLLHCGDEASLSRVFDRALDRESITRRFFRRFRAATAGVSAALAADFPDEDQEAVEAEALLILSRLLFLSFVQEKGWLDGERRFLVDRLEHECSRGREFFSGVLVPLFFSCLNTPLHERTLAARRLGAIPYLNGGLFEPSPFERRHSAIRLLNEVLQPIVEEVFEKFDFRSEEGDGLGTHVDPEMLGKVFESLMAADERSASGSFYTPKEIVDALTERAISEWLGPDADDPARQLARLESITVLDLACGSGAFLLAALGAIEKRWRALAERTGAPVPADLRRRIVARSLYGVDLKPEAVRLCELRLWLAIVSATDVPVERIEPLPNLDRNILQGNSLLGPTDFLGQAKVAIYGEWLQALRAQRDLIERYRTAPHTQRPALARVIRGNDQRLAGELLARSIDADEEELRLASAPRRDLFGRAVPPDAEHCRDLHVRITASRRMLERVEEGCLDFFSFDVHFAPVMAAGGFDLVVGNPPWVRNARIDARARRMVADRYGLFRRAAGGSGFHQPDLSVAFFERATQLAAAGGMVALLMPAKIANASYAAPLRRRIAERFRLVAVFDWSDDHRRRRWFEADTFPLGLVVAGDREPAGEVEVTACGDEFRLPSQLIGGGGAHSEWSLVPPEAAALFRRLRDRHRGLAQVLGRAPLMGVKTGDNGAFFLDVVRVGTRSVTTSDGIVVPLTHLCRCVRGRDLRRWSCAGSSWMLWPPASGWRAVPRWLERLARARGADPSDLVLSFVRPEHVGVKVAWKDLARGMTAAVLGDSVEVAGTAVPLVPNQTLYAIDASSLGEAHALAALLNSTVAGALMLATAERAKDRHYRYFGRTVAALPVPEMSPQWDDLARCARRAAQGAPVEDEIDRLAARLYGITPREQRLLADFVARRLDAGAPSD